MLSEEEEILIKKLRYCEQEYEQNGYLSVGKFKAIKEAVNLIEKQSKEIERTNEIIIWKQRHEEQLQKEIEELKEKNKFLNWYFENQKDNFVHKDKIKAIIEELEKQDKESKLSHNYLVIPVLQSLLEKE